MSFKDVFGWIGDLLNWIWNFNLLYLVALLVVFWLIGAVISFALNGYEDFKFNWTQSDRRGKFEIIYLIVIVVGFIAYTLINTPK